MFEQPPPDIFAVSSKFPALPAISSGKDPLLSAFDRYRENLPSIFVQNMIIRIDKSR